MNQIRNDRKKTEFKRQIVGLPTEYGQLLSDIKARVRSAQLAAFRAANRELVALYWDIGKMIVERKMDAAHGDAVAEHLAEDLRAEFPGIAGFSRRNVFYMREFYVAYHDLPKVQPLVAQIGWTHNLIVLTRCSDPLEREFYVRMTRKFGWSKNVLIHQIENQSYAKTLLNQTNFDKTVTPAIRAQAKRAVKDEYLFDFVELKVGEFEPEFVGKMQFYLAALDTQVREKGENPSIGIILCKEKNRTIVEYALREAKKPIGVATYRIVKQLPRELRGQLPSPAEIGKLLEDVK